ncbi:MAG: hypothetical protein ABF743_06575 [Schleiferilactobacillus perolens]|uniref:hypothetical protein n=1 Tax=Schleiferilactobacillus perolens TaxID=100468 RepID=UPI0039ED8977
MNKWKYFRRLMLNIAPSVLAVSGALIASMLWVKIVFLIFAVVAYGIVSYMQALAMVDNDDFHERIGASVEGMKKAGLLPHAISVNGKQIKGKK